MPVNASSVAPGSSRPGVSNNAHSRPARGDKRTAIEMDVEEIGPSLRYATAAVNRAERGAVPAAVGAGVTAERDPWASGTSRPDEPPF